MSGPNLYKQFRFAFGSGDAAPPEPPQANLVQWLTPETLAVEVILANDDFSGTSLDADRWERLDSNGTLTVSDNTLNIAMVGAEPDKTGRIQLVGSAHEGDFTESLHYKLNTFSNGNQQWIGHEFTIGGTIYTLSRTYNTDGDGDVYRGFNGTTIVTSPATTNTEGDLIFERVGNTLTAKYGTTTLYSVTVSGNYANGQIAWRADEGNIDIDVSVWRLQQGTTPIALGAAIWPDSTSEGNDVTQSTDADRPQPVLSMLNGYTGLRFDITDTLELLAFNQSQPYTFHMVINFTKPASPLTVVGAVYVEQNGFIGGNAGLNLLGSTDRSDTWGVVSGIIDGNSSSIYWDGTVEDSGPIGALSITNLNIIKNTLAAKAMESLIYDAAQSSEAFDATVAALQAKYALA